MTEKTNIGIYIFEGMTMLDSYGPLQFFAAVDDFYAFTFSKTSDLLNSDAGVQLKPNFGFNDCPKIDVLVVGGAKDVLPQLQDEKVLEFLQKVAKEAKYVTSVCTGALILAQAGLLDGHEAATHWASKELLECYPNVTQVDKRVCISKKIAEDGVKEEIRITGGGVTAGMDFALSVIEEVISESSGDPEKGKFSAELTQLRLEYNPDPPFNSGSPDTAPPEAVETVEDNMKDINTAIREYINCDEKGAR